MKAYKKQILKSWWDQNLDYLPLGAKWRGKWQRGQVKRIIKEIDHRKLDIIIAEKVLGYKVEILEFSDYDSECATSYPELAFKIEHPEDPRFLKENRDWPATYEEEIKLPNYSTDIKDAWELVDKINTLGWHFQLEVDAKYRENQTIIEKKEWDPNVVHYLHYGPFYLLGETASEAICLAALKAVEHANR